jgi:hypothetical protein
VHQQSAVPLHEVSPFKYNSQFEKNKLQQQQKIFKNGGSVGGFFFP